MTADYWSCVINPGVNLEGSNLRHVHRVSLHRFEGLISLDNPGGNQREESHPQRVNFRVVKANLWNGPANKAQDED